MEFIETEILVAGGGIAGLTAAAAFAAVGFEVVCVDPAPEGAGSEDERSTAFLVPSVRLLERAGVWERLAPHASPLRVMRIVDAGGPELAVRETADFVSDEVGEPAFGYNLPNRVIRRELGAHFAAASGARLVAAERVERVTPRTAGAIARLAGGGQVRAGLVVAADGRDSELREAAGIRARRWGYGQHAVVCTLSHAVPHGGVSIEIHRAGGPFTLVPLSDREGTPQSALVWMERGPRAAALAEMPAEDFEAEANARACGVLGTLRLAGPRRLWPIVAQVADRLDGPRLALIAEAAHVVPPIGAQGLNMSLGDVAALVELCAAARGAGRDAGAPELLRRYHRTRHPAMVARVLGIDALNRAAMAEAPALRDLRRAGLTMLNGVAPLRRAAMRLGMGGR
jgi:2-octaprenyl-6-methoxyphenol hydroxylase